MTWLAEELTVSVESGYGLVLVVTHEERRALASAFEAASSLGWSCSTWSAVQGLDGTPATAREAASRFAAQPGSGALVMLDVVPSFSDDLALVREVRELARRGPELGKALWLVSPRSELPSELEKEVSIIDLPLPTPDELRAGLEQVCADRGVLFGEDFVDSLVRAAGGLTLDEAQRVFRKALLRGGGHQLGDVDVVIDLKRQILRRGSVLEAFPLDWTLDDVGGLDELKRWLLERQRAFAPDARRFGLPEPRGLLLMGVQGCGKSLSAKAVAGLWRLPLLRLDLAELFGASRPEAELRHSLKVAEAMSPDVLWIDEIEKAFSGDEGGTSNRLLGVIITWLQEKRRPVFVVATANEVGRLPPELTRRGRFDAIFFVDLPDPHERAEIMSLHLRSRNRAPEAYDLSELARQTVNFAGAELEQVVVGGLYRAFAENRDLAQIDLEAEIVETVPLYTTYEDQIKALRQWSKGRARPATLDRSKLDLFRST